MNCPACGNPVREGAAHCGSCGAALPQVQAQPANPFLISVPPGFAPAAAPVVPEPVPQPLASQVVVPSAPFTGAVITPPARADDDIEATRVSARRKRAGWTIELADGQRVTVASAALVGRGPSADGRWPGAALVAVVDSTKTVSKTHAVFEVIDGTLFVTDLNSSNGVLVEWPDGTDHDTDPDVRLEVPSGSSVLIGDFLVKAQKP